VRIVIAIATCALVATSAGAQTPPHEHGHANGEAAIEGLSLNGTARWPTEPSLRSGMAAIRTAFDADHPAIDSGTESDAAYAALAGTIEARVAEIVKSCHLPEDADAQLHLVIADLLAGAGLMKGEPGHSRHDGAARVHGALIAYGRYFDDPGFPPDPHESHHAR
jgi:hypothetical protein